MDKFYPVNFKIHAPYPGLIQKQRPREGRRLPELRIMNSSMSAKTISAELTQTIPSVLSSLFPPEF